MEFKSWVKINYAYNNATNIAEPLTRFLNVSYTSGVFHDKLRLAKIIPVFNADKPSLSNYRPISLLPVFSKDLKKRRHKRHVFFFIYATF